MGLCYMFVIICGILIIINPTGVNECKADKQDKYKYRQKSRRE